MLKPHDMEQVKFQCALIHLHSRAESKEYCEFCATKLERYVLPVLFVSYAVVVAVIFGVAQAQSGSNLDRPVG